MANVDLMREKIRAVYPGPHWQSRVMTMPDNQIIAIYYRFRDAGVFDPKYPIASHKKEEPKSIQMTIWDILPKESS